jgi:hypothetical protein
VLVLRHILVHTAIVMVEAGLRTERSTSRHSTAEHTW